MRQIANVNDIWLLTDCQNTIRIWQSRMLFVLEDIFQGWSAREELNGRNVLWQPAFDIHGGNLHQQCDMLLSKIIQDVFIHLIKHWHIWLHVVRKLPSDYAMEVG